MSAQSLLPVAPKALRWAERAIDLESVGAAVSRGLFSSEIDGSILPVNTHASRAIANARAIIGPTSAARPVPQPGRFADGAWGDRSKSSAKLACPSLQYQRQPGRTEA
jgi:hypothetical protein